MGKQVTELDALPSFTDTSLLPVHNGAGLKKGRLSQLASYLGTKFRNPNLLINPDFKINQRGLSSYSAEASRKYTVDRWGGTRFTATVASNGITILANKSGSAWFSQKLESTTEAGFIVSVHVVSVTGTAKLRATGIEGTLKAGWNYFISASSTSEIAIEVAQGGSLKIDKIKLEQGSIATPFVTPNPAEELLKCDRFGLYLDVMYFIPLTYAHANLNDPSRYYQSTNGVFPIRMRAKPTITYKSLQSSGGNTFEATTSFEVTKDGVNVVILSKNIDLYSIKVVDTFIDAEIY